jgi:hypothetical protein
MGDCAGIINVAIRSSIKDIHKFAYGNSTISNNNIITIAELGGGNFRYAFQSRVPCQFIDRRIGGYAASRWRGTGQVPHTLIPGINH